MSAMLPRCAGNVANTPSSSSSSSTRPAPCFSLSSLSSACVRHLLSLPPCRSSHSVCACGDRQGATLLHRPHTHTHTHTHTQSVPGAVPSGTHLTLQCVRAYTYDRRRTTPHGTAPRRCGRPAGRPLYLLSLRPLGSSHVNMQPTNRTRQK